MKQKRKIPAAKRNHIFLARLRMKLMEELGIVQSEFANISLIKKKLFEAHRDNEFHGMLLMRLFGLKETWVVQIKDLSAAFDLDELFDDLESSPWPDARFLEIQSGTAARPNCTGAFIHQEELRDGGRVYMVTMMNEDDFPLVFHAEIRASRKNPEPFFSPLSHDGYLQFSRAYIRDSWEELEPQIKLAFMALHFLNTKRHKLEMRPSDGARQNVRELFPPPKDKLFDALIRQVALGKTSCIKLEVPLCSIRPADYEFAILLPTPLVRPFILEIAEGDRPELLVYWHEGAFIASDDYAAYLAYRTLKTMNVPVVVMGNYPTAKFGLGEFGGPELLPNVTFRYSRLPSNPTEQDDALESRIRSELTPNATSRLYSLVFQLHRHLNNPLTKERTLHDLLIRGAKEFVDGAFRIFSEVSLGKKYRIDLVIQPADNMQRVVLVELERSNLPIFTKTGAPTAHVTHALQQVEDWLRFWHEHPGEIPHIIDPTIVPSGLVIIGRSNALSEDQRRRLLSLNANRRVQLMTYDELAERLETYVAWNA